MTDVIVNTAAALSNNTIGGSSFIEVANPAGDAGDIIIHLVGQYITEASPGPEPYISTPAGWTAMIIIDEVEAKRCSGIFWRVHNGSLAATTRYNFTGPGASSAVALVYKGVDATTPFDVSYEQAWAKDDRNPSNPKITPVSPKTMALISMQYSHGAVPDNQQWPPSGWTQIANQRISGNNIQVAEQYHANAGVEVVPGPWQNGGTQNSPESQLYTLVLRPEGLPTNPPLVSVSGTLSDARATTLQKLGYTGSTPDMLYQWCVDNGATAKDKNSAMLECLNTLGGGTWKTVTDAWFEMLRAGGYSGSRSDMEIRFWQDLEPADPAPPPDPGGLDDLVDALIAEGWDAVLLPPDAIKVDDFDGWVTITTTELVGGSYLTRTDISNPLKADISQWINS